MNYELVANFQYLYFMKTFIAFFILLFPISVLQAQRNDSVYTIVQQMPKFNENVVAYISHSIEFPEIKNDSVRIETRPIISFIVEKDGSVSTIRILNPSRPDFDSSIVKCVRKMPKWQPGMQNNKLVRVRFTLPIEILLR